MKIYIAIKNESVIIGTKKVYTKKYEDYLGKLYKYKEYEENYPLDLFGGYKKPEFMDEEYQDKNIIKYIPTIIRITTTDIQDEFETFDSDNPYKECVWIHEVEVDKDVEILSHLHLTFN